MQQDSAGDFARLRPSNQLAKHLFSRCYLYVKEEDPFHLQFMITLPNQPPASTEDPVESSTDYDSCDPSGYEEHLKDGCFVLSLEKDRTPEFPLLGWRCGRGSRKLPYRGVDFLLAKPGDINSKSLASVHFMLKISPQLGLLMLQCGPNKDVALEVNMNGSWRLLGPEEERLMYQLFTALRIGRCEFELQYTIDPCNRDDFIARRNRFLKNATSSLNAYLPGDNVIVRGRFLQFMTVGHGSFGWVTQGADTWSGNLIAIKECHITSKSQWPEIEKEVEYGRLFRARLLLLIFKERKMLKCLRVEGKRSHSTYRCALRTRKSVPLQ